MKQKRIQYSEPSASHETRTRRTSTPVELARALASLSVATSSDAIPAPVVRETEIQSTATADAPTAVLVDGARSLRARARTRSGLVDLLKFRIGTERFAVELVMVKEVIDLPRIHHVPEMPPAMLGVIATRDHLTPVYSPQHALGTTLATSDAVLIFRSGRSSVGLLIDDVDDAITVNLRELRDTPGAKDDESIVIGVVRCDDALVALVDADALIAACQHAALLETA